MTLLPPPPGFVLAERYELLAPLGTGAFGVVFRARDLELGREVAVKLLLDRHPGGPAAARFEREAEASASLCHPNVVQVHVRGHDQGRAYIVFDLVRGGRTLDDVWRGATLEGRLDLLAQVAAGVGAAHALGIVHRDLKPENVLVDAEGRALVADFGVARDTQAERLTRTGELIGTPAYMSPEQLAGGSHGAGPPADVWALGVLLYEALFDLPPFPALSLLDLIAKVHGTDPPWPAHERQALVGLARTALAKDPADRPPDGGSFARALSEARAVSPRSRTSLAVCLAASLTLCGAALLGWSLSASPPAQSPVPAVISPSPAREVEPEQRAPPPHASSPGDVDKAGLRAFRSPEPDFTFRLPHATGNLCLLEGEELVAASSQFGWRVWALAEEPRVLELDWSLPAGSEPAPGSRSDYLIANAKDVVVVASQTRAWRTSRLDRSFQPLPSLDYVPIKVALAESEGQHLLAVASLGWAACGPLGAPLRAIALRDQEVSLLCARGERVALLLQGERRGPLQSYEFLLTNPLGHQLGASQITLGPTSFALGPRGGLLLGQRLGGVAFAAQASEFPGALLDQPHEGSVRSVACAEDAPLGASLSKHSLALWALDGLPRLLGSVRLPGKKRGDQVLLSPRGTLVLVRLNAEILGWRIRL